MTGTPPPRKQGAPRHAPDRGGRPDERTTTLLRFTIHTPDGYTYTTPDGSYPLLDSDGTGALHIIRSGGWGTIAVFPAGQWTRYVPADGEHEAAEGGEATEGGEVATDKSPSILWAGLFEKVEEFLTPKIERDRSGQRYVVGEAAPLYGAYLRLRAAGIR